MDKPVAEGSAVTSPALAALLATIDRPDPLSLPPQELEDLRLQAAREVLAVRREQIQVLRRRADEAGVKDIQSTKDLVPLLFSHTTYKSYPANFISKGHWDRLLKWFGTLSAIPVDNVNVDGVKDVDEFIERLWAAGHLAVTTSGTTGKVSFLHRVQEDNELWRAWCAKHFEWPGKVTPNKDRHHFQMTPKSGPYMMMATAPMLIDLFARPDSIHYLSEDRLRIAYLMRAGEMRLKMADGSATPQEIAQFESDAKTQAELADAQLEKIITKILELRHEPMFLTAQWGMLWRIMERAREMGIGDGEFHPETIVTGGGGLKGKVLPDDYENIIRKFLGNVHLSGRYGMSEQSVSAARCEAGNYHPVPWVIPMVLDGTGEHLLDHQGGIVEGRYAILDLSFHARWGGTITGDKVRMDFSSTCKCGRAGPVVLPGITRFTNLGEEDKIGCAGTIEAYIRGSLNE